MAELTDKMRLFAQEYMIDLNATQAAIRAGYSEKTAGEIGHENLKKPQIAAYIQQLMNERSKRTEVTADMVLQELAKIGFADMKNYVSFKTTLTKVGENDGQDVLDYATVVELKDSGQVDGSVISEISLKDGALRFKLHDKKGALDSIGRHLGMFDKDTLNVNVQNKLEDFFK